MRTLLFTLGCTLALAQSLGAQQPEPDKPLPARAMLRLSNQTNMNFLAMSPDGKIVAGALETKLTAWDARTGKELWHEKLCEPVGPRCAAFTPDGETLVAAGDFGVLRFFDANTGKKSIDAKPFAGQESWWAMAISPDGRHLATLGFYATLGLWDVKTGKQTHLHTALGGVSPSVAFAHDSSRLIISSRGSYKIFLWDPVSRKETNSLQLDGNSLEMARFAPDGKSIALRHNDSSIRFLDASTGRETNKIAGTPTPMLINKFAFSPDGRTIALTKVNDPLVILLETATGLERARFTGHTGHAYLLTFASSGRTLASSATDKNVFLWDLTGAWRDGKYPAAKLGPDDLAYLWKTLGDPQADEAYRSIWKLALAPEQSVPYLRARFLPDGVIITDDLAKRVAELGDDDFNVREKALADLKRLGPVAEKALRNALGGPLSAEAKARVRSLLPTPSKIAGGPSRLHLTRALEALELADSPLARKTLEDLSRGHTEDWIPEEARAALKRVRP